MAIGKQLKQALAEWRKWSEDIKPEDIVFELRKQASKILHEIKKLEIEKNKIECFLFESSSLAKKCEERVAAEEDNINAINKGLIGIQKSLAFRNRKFRNYKIRQKEEESDGKENERIERPNNFKRKYSVLMKSHVAAEKSLQRAKYKWMKADENRIDGEQLLVRIIEQYRKLKSEAKKVYNLLKEKPEEVVVQQTISTYYHLFELIPQWVASQNDENISTAPDDKLNEQEWLLLNDVFGDMNSVQDYLAMERDLLQEPEESSTSISSPQADPRVH